MLCCRAFVCLLHIWFYSAEMLFILWWFLYWAHYFNICMVSSSTLNDAIHICVRSLILKLWWKCSRCSVWFWFKIHLHVHMHTPNCKFVLEKTKSKECACYLKWTVMKSPLALSAWRGMFYSPELAPWKFVPYMEMHDCSFQCFCYSSADEQEHYEGVIFKFQLLPYSPFVWGF